MNIVVCVKQVPDTSDIRWSEDNTIIREGLESILNPYDAYAIDFALKVKKKVGGKITVVTMAPKQGENVLRNAIALGCDEAILISDKKFAASDTLATSKILAAAIKKIGFDLIICGQFAIDGDTAQTPPMLAQKLKIPQITFVSKLLEVADNTLIIEKNTENKIQIISSEIPLLIAVTEMSEELSQPLINGYKKAQLTEIKTFNFEDLELSSEDVGIKGSPTYVSKTFKFLSSRNCNFIENVDDGVKFLKKELEI